MADKLFSITQKCLETIEQLFTDPPVELGQYDHLTDHAAEFIVHDFSLSFFAFSDCPHSYSFYSLLVTQRRFRLLHPFPR